MSQTGHNDGITHHKTPQEVPDDVRSRLRSCGLEVGTNNVVFWLEDAPAHPENWVLSRKLYDTGVLTLFIAVSYVSW